MRTLLLILIPSCFAAGVVLSPGFAHAGGAVVGEPAPALEIKRWLAAPEGQSLADLEGRVVLLLCGGAGDVTSAEAALPWNDLRAAYLEKGLRIIALPKGPDAVPAAVEYSVAIGSAAAFGEGGGAHAALIDAKGTLAWSGEPAELPEVLLAKLMRKTKLFRLPVVDPSLKPMAGAFKKGKLDEARTLAETSGHADAAPVKDRIAALITYWQAQVRRATAAGNPAEAAYFLRLLSKHLGDAPEAENAGAQLKALKSDKAAAKAIKAASAYTRLRSDLCKTQGKRKKLDALGKKADRAAASAPDARGGERAARLATRVKTDPAVAAVRAFIAKEKISTKSASWRTSLPRPRQVDFVKKRTYFWTLSTSEGVIKLKLFPEAAPMHVSNTIFLTELGFFDGLGFHRVIPGFMAQGGCPKGTGSGQPGYSFDGEFDSDKKHDSEGILSAANAGPGTDNSQFFITFAPTAHLDGKHTVFGIVVKGGNALKKIEKFGTAGGAPTKKIIIEKAVITVE